MSVFVQIFFNLIHYLFDAHGFVQVYSHTRCICSFKSMLFVIDLVDVFFSRNSLMMNMTFNKPDIKTQKGFILFIVCILSHYFFFLHNS